MATADEQEPTDEEVALDRLGRNQLSFSRAFDPVRDFISQQSAVDDTELLGGRANTDASLAFDPSVATQAAAQGAGMSAARTISNLAVEGRAEAVQNAGQQAQTLKDGRAVTDLGVRLGDVSASSRMLGETAKIAQERAQQKAALAQERKAAVTSAVVTLGTSAASKRLGQGSDLWGRARAGDPEAEMALRGKLGEDGYNQWLSDRAKTPSLVQRWRLGGG